MQIEGFVELGVRTWVPTGTASLMAHMSILSRNDRSNIIAGMVGGGQ